MSLMREAKADLRYWFFRPDKPWQRKSRSAYGKYLKKCIVRSERRRVQQDIECFPEYKRYEGYEF